MIANIEIIISPDLEFFKGHFPGNPVTPGYILIDWAISFATESFSLPESFKSLSNVKFHTPVRPGDTIRLTAEASGDGKVIFKYTFIDGRDAASGEIYFPQ